MKRTITVVIAAILLTIIFGDVWAYFVFKNTDNSRDVIAAGNEKVYTFTYPFRNGVHNTFDIVLNQKQTISLNFWKMNLIGGVQIKVKTVYMDDKYLSFPDSGEPYWVDHVLNEVRIGENWIQADFGIGTSYLSLNKPYIKLISFHDPTDIDFRKYSKLDFFRERPYKYVSIIEQEKKPESK